MIFLKIWLHLCCICIEHSVLINISFILLIINLGPAYSHVLIHEHYSEFVYHKTNSDLSSTCIRINPLSWFPISVFHLHKNKKTHVAINFIIALCLVIICHSNDVYYMLRRTVKYNSVLMLELLTFSWLLF